MGTRTGRVAPAQKAPNRRRGLTLTQQMSIVFGGGTLLAGAIGAYLIMIHAGASVADAANSSTPPQYTGAIISRATNGDGCHRMKFNNTTGTISDDGPTPCDSVDSPLSSAAAKGRFGAIAGSFQRR
jgi:hypothetical protein